MILGKEQTPHLRGCRAVFFDRDGVLNELIFRDGVPEFPRNLEEFRLDDEAAAELTRLRAAGFRLFVVTNQPGISLGLVEPAVLSAMSELLLSRMPVERVMVCPHVEADRCSCRKPNAGMLWEVAQRDGIQLRGSYIIGDTWRDVGAGRAAGCTTILLRREYNLDVVADHVVERITDAVDVILASA